MKNYLRVGLLLIFCNQIIAQISYQSPLGFSLNFNSSWKRLPKDILQNKMTEVQNFLDYKKEISFDACYQKVGKPDMAYPYILFKNYFFATTDENEIKEAKDYFIDHFKIDSISQYVFNKKIDIELSVDKNYYDSKNKLLIFTFDISIEEEDFVGILAMYFGKSATLMTSCYSRKNEFLADQKEFLEIIYSLKDIGMTMSLSDYTKQHDIAVNHYNEGLQLSTLKKRSEAIISFTKAIENYSIEDFYLKAEAYYNRGIQKRYLEDYKGAIADYSKAISLRVDYYKAYNNRGYAKLLTEDYAGAISDFTLTIKYDNYNTELSSMAIGNRGISKLAIGQDGCADIKKAIELGNKNVVETYTTYCK